MTAYFRFEENSPLIEVTDTKNAEELIQFFQKAMSTNKTIAFNTGDGVTLIKNMGRISSLVVYETTTETPTLKMQIMSS